VVVNLQGETLQKTPMQGGTLLKKRFFKKANIVRKMNFYKDKSIFLCQCQLFIVLLHRVCAELPTRAGLVWARFYWKKRHTTLCFWSLEPEKFKRVFKTMQS
jgi:hypothetical protein